MRSGAGNVDFAALVGRHTRTAMLSKVSRKDTIAVFGALAKHMRKSPAELRRSPRWDCGENMAIP